MNSNLTEIVCILDKSGSMYSLSRDTVGGYNSFIEEQKKIDGEAFVTTVLFNEHYQLLHDHVDIHSMLPMSEDDYLACGMTALYDAIGITIDNVGKRLAETPEDQRPSKVIVVITTDGYENSSKEYSKARIKQMIEHQQNKYSWEFIFLGAGIDAKSEADSIGINGLSASVRATTDGINCMFTTMACQTKAIRTGDFSSVNSALSSCAENNAVKAVHDITPVTDLLNDSITNAVVTSSPRTAVDLN